MSPRGSVSELIARVKQGDREARDELFVRYFQKLLEQVVKPPGVRPAALDSGIAAQSALRTVLSRLQAGKTANVLNRNQLWWFLLRKLRDKTIDQWREQGAQKRGGGQTDEEARAGDSEVWFFVESADPTPHDVLVFKELYNRAVECLGDMQLQQIAILRLEGYRSSEIGERVGLAVRTTELRQKRILEIWEHSLAGLG